MVASLQGVYGVGTYRTRSAAVLMMRRYCLIHRFGRAEPLEYSNQPFSTENEAMAQACSLIGAGELGDFLVKDGANRMVAGDTEIRERCKASSRGA